MRHCPETEKTGSPDTRIRRETRLSWRAVMRGTLSRAERVGKRAQGRLSQVEFPFVLSLSEAELNQRFNDCFSYRFARGSQNKAVLRQAQHERSYSVPIIAKARAISAVSRGSAAAVSTSPDGGGISVEK